MSQVLDDMENMDGLDEINGVIVGNKLQRIGDAVDQVLLANHGWHSELLDG